MLKLKTVKTIRHISQVLVSLNMISAAVAMFLAYGTVGTMDYNVEMKIHLTEDAERALYLQATMYVLIAVCSVFFAYAFKKFTEFCDKAIEYRRAKARKNMQVQNCDNVSEPTY